MADNKKYLDLNGLSYYTRKLDSKKANIESPALTGTPTVNGKNILLNDATDDSVLLQTTGEDNGISIVATQDNVTLFSGKQILLDSVGNIALHTSGAGTATYNGSKIMTEANVSDKLDEELDTRLDNALDEKVGDKIVETVGDQLDLKADIDSPELTGTPTAPTAATGDNSKQIANTEWVEGNYINKHGNAVVDGTLTVIGKTYPLLTLKSSTSTSSGYLMNIQGNLMFGNCMSNDASRQYYGRYVPLLSKAIVGAVSIGYNPKDNANYKNTTDYGIKFDVDVANGNLATPTIQHQSASFFVGVNGGYVGYSGSASKPLNFDTQVYRILDSNNIKEDEYVKSLEQRIAELEEKVEQLTSAVEMLGV